MSDLLVRLAAHPGARRLMRRLALPIPLPRKLRRSSGPWEQQPLADRTVVVGGGPGAELQPWIAKTLIVAGANPTVASGGDEVFRHLGEAYGRPPTSVDAHAPVLAAGIEGLVFDATGLGTPASLRALYDFFHPMVANLRPSGRAIVLGRPAAEAPSPVAAATRAALEGFVRSLAREVGKRGGTAQLLVVHPGAEARLEPVLRFLLSSRAAFVSGQPISVTGLIPFDGEPAFVRPLDRRVALVTGAARGIGEATARLLAAEGAHVVCLDHPADDGPASRVARSVGGSVLLVDLAGAAAPATVAQHLRERHGGVDIVVHNAGITRDKTLARMAPEMWDQTIAINLEAIARIDESLLGGVLRDGGRLICVASVAGIAGNFGQTNYATSKAGVIGYIRRQAGLLAPRGITVNAVAPGFIETRLTATMPVIVREAGRRLSALAQGGLPGDVGDVITFLATPGAAGITGAVVRVCGGALMGA